MHLDWCRLQQDSHCMMTNYIFKFMQDKFPKDQARFACVRIYMTMN